MTNAPNFGTEFGRRRPCPRYIGPLLGTTSVAPVGRGDLTPPLPRRTPPPQVCSNASVGGGLCPAPQGPCSAPIPVGSGTLPAPRRGEPMCPPVNGSPNGTCPGRHIGRPLQNLRRPRKPGRDRAPPAGTPEASAPGRRTQGRASADQIPHSQFTITLDSPFSIINYPFSIPDPRSSPFLPPLAPPFKVCYTGDIQTIPPCGGRRRPHA